MRLPNGYGSVYKVSGNRRRPWAARVTTGWTPDGKLQRYLIGYYKTKAEALEALAAYNKNPIGEIRDKTLGDLYSEWSDRYYNKDLSKSTVDSYKAAWRRLSVLENRQVRELRKTDLQDIVEDMIAEGLSRSSLEKVKTLAVLLWDEAMANDIVDRNYGSMIELPKSRKAKKPTFTDFEISLIKRAADAGNVWAGTIMILIYTGMRVGELVRLTRFNVDLDAWTITGGIKTDAGRDRVMPVHPKIRPYITWWVNNPGPRLIHRDGQPISVDYYRKSIFYPTLERLEIDYKSRGLTPHCARHTFATLLAKAGAKTTAIQRLMGHSDYATTANTYTHPDFRELWEAVNQI
jgi:integrase